jgi:hypothetical protein
MGEPGGQRRGLASARPGEHQHRSLGRQHGFALWRVQAGEISRLRGEGGGFRHLAEVGAGADSGNADKVPPVVTDIPVIHRLTHPFFALRDSWRGALSSGDRDGGRSLLRAAVTKEPISAGRQWRVPSGIFRGQSGRGAGRDDLPFARRGFSALRSGKSKAGRRSGHPKKGRGTSELLRLRARHERTQVELSSGSKVWESEALTSRCGGKRRLSW